MAEFLALPSPIPPLRFDRGRAQVWEPGHNLTNFTVVQIGARQRANRWTREGWRAICRHLLEQLETVVVTCGPGHDEIEQAEWLQRQLGLRVLCTKGQATWPQMADLLYRARLYVGPNTAAMHLAAACGCPVIALFGPSIEDNWYPWQTPHRIVTSRAFIPSDGDLERYAQIQKRSMGEIRADDVIAACAALLASSARRVPTSP